MSIFIDFLFIVTFATLVHLSSNNWPCYSFYNGLQSFPDSEVLCQTEVGYLASVPNDTVNYFIADSIRTYFGESERCWIGVHLLNEKWINIDDGTESQFFNWAAGEPSNSSNAPCVAVDANGYWYAMECSQIHVFVCEVPEENQTTSTTSPSTTISDQYLPCKSFISFSADVSQVLSTQAFQNQLNFIAGALNQINHPEMIDYNSGPNLVVPWMSGISLHEIQNQVTGTKQNISLAYRLRPILGGLLSAIENITPNSTPVGAIVFVTDTTTAGSIDGSDQYATMLKNQGVKLTFVLMGPNVDQNKLTNLTTNFVTWTDLTKPQPDNWDPFSAFACPGSSTQSTQSTPKQTTSRPSQMTTSPQLTNSIQSTTSTPIIMTPSTTSPRSTTSTPITMTPSTTSSQSTSSTPITMTPSTISPQSTTSTQIIMTPSTTSPRSTTSTPITMTPSTTSAANAAVMPAYTCRSYIPFSYDVSTKLSADEFTAMKQFLLNPFLQPVFPIDIQPALFSSYSTSNFPIQRQVNVSVIVSHISQHMEQGSSVDSDITAPLSYFSTQGVMNNTDGLPVNTVIYAGTSLHTSKISKAQTYVNQLTANGNTVTVVLVDPNIDQTNYKMVTGLNIVVWSDPATTIANIEAKMNCNGGCPKGTTAVPSAIISNWPCLLFESSTAEFLLAEHQCADNEGHLVSIPNSYFNTFLELNANKNFGSGNSKLRFWIGIDNLLENGWHSMDDGSLIIYNHWASEEPSNSSFENGCISMDLNGNWYNDDCFNSYLYVCGVNAVPDTTTTTTTTVPPKSSSTTTTVRTTHTVSFPSTLHPIGHKTTQVLKTTTNNYPPDPSYYPCLSNIVIAFEAAGDISTNNIYNPQIDFIVHHLVANNSVGGPNLTNWNNVQRVAYAAFERSTIHWTKFYHFNQLTDLQNAIASEKQIFGISSYQGLFKILLNNITLYDTQHHFVNTIIFTSNADGTEIYTHVDDAKELDRRGRLVIVTTKPNIMSNFLAWTNNNPNRILFFNHTDPATYAYQALKIVEQFHCPSATST